MQGRRQFQNKSKEQCQFFMKFETNEEKKYYLKDFANTHNHELSRNPINMLTSPIKQNKPSQIFHQNLKQQKN